MQNLSHQNSAVPTPSTPTFQMLEERHRMRTPGRCAFSRRSSLPIMCMYSWNSQNDRARLGCGPLRGSGWDRWKQATSHDHRHGHCIPDPLATLLLRCPTRWVLPKKPRPKAQAPAMQLKRLHQEGVHSRVEHQDIACCEGLQHRLPEAGGGVDGQPCGASDRCKCQVSNLTCQASQASTLRGGDAFGEPKWAVKAKGSAPVST